VLKPGTDVVASDDEVVGKVQRVMAVEDEDIFHGLVIDVKLGPGGLHFVAPEQIAEMYENAVLLTVAADAIDQLPKP
jgi:hypothetical protein